MWTNDAQPCKLSFVTHPFDDGGGEAFEKGFSGAVALQGEEPVVTAGLAQPPQAVEPLTAALELAHSAHAARALQRIH